MPCLNSRVEMTNSLNSEEFRRHECVRSASIDASSGGPTHVHSAGAEAKVRFAPADEARGGGTRETSRA